MPQSNIPKRASAVQEYDDVTEGTIQGSSARKYTIPRSSVQAAPATVDFEGEEEEEVQYYHRQNWYMRTFWPAQHSTASNAVLNFALWFCLLLLGNWMVWKPLVHFWALYSVAILCFALFLSIVVNVLLIAVIRNEAR